MSTIRQDVDFNGLFKKLGHHLEEIRVRALENILSKLEHKLICDSDLVQERHLFIRLLEWFNFPKTTRHSDVLHLLLRLSQHTSAAEVIQDVGGIDFLTRLRKDVSPALQPIIDQILENAMKLPDVQGLDHAPACIYQRHDQSQSGMTTRLETTVGSTATRQTQDVTGTSTIHSHQPVGAYQLPDYREPPLGYFDGGGHLPPPPQIKEQGQLEFFAEEPSCFRMTTFPWLALTPTDRHVIVSTNSSLQSREEPLLISTCEFLSDVVFQDFPAEVFLQRPNIVKNLMSLISGPSKELYKPRIHAIRALADYATCLHCKIKCHQDPNLYTPKQDFSSTPSAFSTPTSSSSANTADARPSVIGWTDTRPRGDGQDGDTSASSTGSSQASSVAGFGAGPETEQMDFEDMPSLQYIQLTVSQFCSSVWEKALPLLRTSDEPLVTEVFHLLGQTLEILMPIMSPDVWEDASLAAREMIDKLNDSMDMMASLLRYHHHSNMPFDLDDSEQEGPADLVQHRLAYIGLSVFLNRFLTSFVPLDKCKGIVPESLVSAMGSLVFDESLGECHPDVQMTLLGYLQVLDGGMYSVYVATAGICQSLQKTCKFLMLSEEEASRLNKETLQLSEAALASLPYSNHMPYITETVRLCSDICTKSQHFEPLQAGYRKLVMKLLAHPVSRIRHHAYTTVLQTVQTHLSVAKASDPASTSCEKVKFLLEADLLYEIIVFGLADNDTKISNTASDLVCHLLKAQLLMTTDMWQSFNTCLLRALPVLQSYSGITTILGNTILSMLEPKKTITQSDLPLLEKFRGTLRCMLSTDLKVRAEALKRLSWFLTNEDDGSKKLPIYSDLDVTNLSNLFVVETPRSVDEDLGRSVFQVDGLRKVYEIFTSLSVDPGVKKSAVDQLAIILQDQTLHPAFRKDGGLEKVLEHIQLAILKDGESNTNAYIPYLPGCVTILRSLVHHDYSLRHKLAHDAQIYHSLLRVALLYTRDERTLYEVSHTLTLLLFDELARFFIRSNKNTTFSVPQVVKLRYKLPFRSAIHYDKSFHEVAAPADPDPLLTGLPLEMLRVTWNVAWHGGMEALLKGIASNILSQDAAEFSPKLKLSPTDKVILMTSHIKQGLQAGVHDIANATSHYSVGRSLTRLLSHIVPRADPCVMDILHTLDWCSTLGRFVKVIPSSTADETLLMDILKFISMVLKLTNHVPDNILQWVGEVLYHPKGPLIGLLHRQSAREAPEDVSEPLVNIKRSLDKSLLAFIATYNRSLPYVLYTRLKFHQVRGDLAHKLLLRLNVTDAPHFYNLASLEGTLQCLMHITARPGWSEECTEHDSKSVCSQVLVCLLEVVSAFHVGRGGSSMSYMGKGVTKAATLCLRHLMYEMATVSDDKDWPNSWLYSRHGTDVRSDTGLDWMLTLWAYRDAEVRTAGLGIAVALTSVEAGRKLMTSNCKHIPGGIWGAAFSILLDQSECSMVRQQAAFLLVNLTSQSMPSGTGDSDQGVWQGPVVMDTDYQVQLSGLPALLALLHHSQFYREMSLLLSSYYPQQSIMPAVVTDLGHISTATSENTLSMLADAGLMPRSGSTSASHQQTMSLLQTTAGSSHIPERLVAVGANGQRPHTPAAANGSNMATPRGQGQSEGQQRGTTEYQSVTTPCLVSGVSQLVRNLMVLAPQDTVTCLKNESLLPFFVSMIDASFLEGIQVLTTAEQLELFFTELVQMHIDILRLLQTCLVHDTSTRMDILEDRVSLGGVVSLLRIYSDVSEDTRCACRTLWQVVLSFLTTLVQVQDGPALEVLTQVLQKQWPPITANLLWILESSQSDVQLYTQYLHFLSVVCAEEGKLCVKRSTDNNIVTMTMLLNQPLQPESEDKDAGQISAGSKFCKALVSSYDLWMSRKADPATAGDKLHVTTALKCLLAVSQSAKATALEMGLVENLMEGVKQAHVKLSMVLLQPGKPAVGKAREEPAILELVVMLDLLRNFMYEAEDVKMAAYHCGLHAVLHKLWSWCQLDANLMSSVLSLLTTYTAMCPTACSSLAYTSATAASAAGTTKSGLSSHSLVHSVIKYVTSHKLKEPMLRCLFGLLSNLALSSECRNIIWKSNFLRDFSEFNPKKSKSSKGKKHVHEILYLELLLNLSFSTEGQQMILNIPDSVDLLLEFTDCRQTRQQECAVILLRNLCCHSSNKPRLLANEKLLPRLLQCVATGDKKLRAVAASALWALIFNNQKAKVFMKNANIAPKLQEILNNLVDIPETELAEKYTTDIQAVIATVSQ